MKHSTLKWLFMSIMLCVGVGAWGQVSSVAPADGKSYVIAAYVNSKYYALPNGTVNGSTITGVEISLNKLNKVNTSDAAGKTWTLEEGTEGNAGKYYLTYTSGSDTYYLYKNGTGKNNYNFAINKTSKNYWSFTTNGTGYTVAANGRGDNNVNVQCNAGTFRCYSEATPIILLEIGNVPTKDPIGIFGDVADIEIAVGANQTFDASGYFTIDGDATQSATLAVTPEEGAGTHAYFKDGKIFATSYGTEEFTITATPDAADSEKYGNATKKFNVKVLKVPDLSGITATSVGYGETHTVTAPSAGSLTVASSNTTVASVSGTVITAEAVGTSTITVTSAKNEEYIAGETSFVLTVTAPEGGTAAKVSTPIVLFEETFANCDGTGPSGDSWSGNIASSTFDSDNDGWTSTSNKYAGNGCARFGTGSSTGNATTPAISFDGTTIYTLTFKAGAWNGDGTTLTLSCDDDNAVIGKISFTMSNNAWSNFETTVKAASGSKLTFSSSSKRFFLDDVKLTKPGADPTETVTLNASGYATFCSVYPLDFSAATSYSAWQITDADKDAITFEQITGVIKGGQGIFLTGEAGATINIPSKVSEDVTLENNLLVGTTAPTYVTTEANGNVNFGLSGDTFRRINAGKVPAGKAYLPVASVDAPAAEAHARFIFKDETSGIDTVREMNVNDGAIYNLAGQKMQKLQKGINIVNGKKIFVK